MKRFALVLAFALLPMTATAGGLSPVVQPEVVAAETASASSSGAILVPILTLLFTFAITR